MDKACGRVDSVIAEIIQLYSEVFSKFDWLFVCIDSSREEDLTDASKYIAEDYAKKNVLMSPAPVGLVVPKSHIVLAAQIEEEPLIVRYSAAYLFEDASSIREWPHFSETGDCCNFDESISPHLLNDTHRCGAVAYFCDGTDGVNYYLADRVLAETLDRQGFFDL